MISEYRLKRRVQFHETDMAGIVHFSNFFRYMEEAEHAMWRAAGVSIVPPDAQGSGARIGWPRVAASFEYKRPLRFEDEFEVHIRVVAKTGKTVRYEVAVSRGDERIGAGTMTIACVRKVADGGMKGTEIPSEINALIQVTSADDSTA